MVQIESVDHLEDPIVGIITHSGQKVQLPKKSFGESFLDWPAQEAVCQQVKGWVAEQSTDSEIQVKNLGQTSGMIPQEQDSSTSIGTHMQV